MSFKNWIRLGVGVLTLLSLFWIGGCATTEKVAFERLPKPQVVAENGKPKMRSGGFIAKDLKELSPQLKDLVVNDRFYVYITREWFEQLRGWTDRYIAQIAPGLGEKGPALPGYTRTYSMLMNSAANFGLARRYNVKASVLIGLMVVKNNKAWGDIPGDGVTHDYLVGLTATGGIVVDLETGQSIQFADFPNKESIVGMLF